MQGSSFDFQKNHFQLFGLPLQYRIDGAELDRQFHRLQAQVHPDKFTHLPEFEQRASLQWATRVNEAYQTLRSPLGRARYLLKINGVDTQEETNTSMPLDFLMEQMELREAISAARVASDVDQLVQIESQLKQDMSVLRGQLEVTIDDERNYVQAAESVRKLKFLEKLVEELASTLDELDY